MSLDRGRPFVSIPGPSVVPDRVLSAMHRAMPNIYEGDLIDVSLSIFRDLPLIARTSGQAFVAAANGHGAWEMALTNTLSRGDRVLVVESGHFARVWGDMAARLGVVVDTLPGDDRGPVDPAAVEQRLRADTERTIAAVLVVHTDTASSVCNDIAAIRGAIDAADHPALLQVDCIASMACDRFEMDAWGVDVAMTGSQKGLMTPPGLGVVFANDRAMKAHSCADLRTGYWDWTARMSEGGHYLRYCGTPPLTHLYGLREALDMLLEEGIEAVWDRHAVLADAVRAAVAAWSLPGGLEFNIVDPAARSNAVTSIRTGSVDAVELQRVTRDRAGLTLGLGIGAPDASFRIGHMGHLNPPMVLGTLATTEAALLSLDAPLGGSGVAAAAAVVAAGLR